MHEKIKVGDIEMVKPNDNLIRITEAIIEQNKIILEMNARLLAEINTPPWIVGIDKDTPKD